jgi:membrane protease YdiL (CAAX protease family)
MAALIALGYASRFVGGKPDPQVLYRWSTAVGGVIQEAIVVGLVLAIAGSRRDLLALRRPRSIPTALRLLGVSLVLVYAFEVAYSHLAHPGNEQGLTPAHWEPRHALAYVVNGIVICTVVPFAEEVTFRGLGYALLERFGRWPAILAVGLAFGLAHGLVVSLPIIVAFGCVLAWIRARTGSVYPGMLLHATFNLIALVAAVTIGG